MKTRFNIVKEGSLGGAGKSFFPSKRKQGWLVFICLTMMSIRCATEGSRKLSEVTNQDYPIFPKKSQTKRKGKEYIYP